MITKAQETDGLKGYIADAGTARFKLALTANSDLIRKTGADELMILSEMFKNRFPEQFHGQGGTSAAV